MTDSVTDRGTDGRIDERSMGRTKIRSNGRMDRLQMNGWKDGRTGRTDAKLNTEVDLKPNITKIFPK